MELMENDECMQKFAGYARSLTHITELTTKRIANETFMKCKKGEKALTKCQQTDEVI